MSPQTVTGIVAPTLEALEEACELVKREAERALEWARDELRTMQDAAVELEDEWTQRAVLRHNRAAFRLRQLARMLSRAQLELVHPQDERASSIAHVRRYLDEAERSDGPWRDAA